MMRPVTVRLSAVGNSPWVQLSQYTSSFGIGLGVKLSSNGNLTYTIQHTFDDIHLRADTTLSRVTTSLSVKKINHGLSTNDWAQLSGTPIWDGEYAVASVTDQNTFVVTVADTGVTSGVGFVQTARVFNHAELAAETASADGNYQFPPTACRLNVSVYTAGYVDLTVVSGGQ